MIIFTIRYHLSTSLLFFFFFFFFNDTATTEIYTLSLHDALPICSRPPAWPGATSRRPCTARRSAATSSSDRKSTRLNSSHANISYAVFCLKKKNYTDQQNACRRLHRHDARGYRTH